jgi:hypothetical protein
MHLMGIFKTILLLATLQGMILTGLLFYSRNRRPSNRILAALIFVISLASLNLYLSYAEWVQSDPFYG